MSYAIMRCKKIKNFGAFGGAVQHCFRERKTENADPNLSEQNVNYRACSEAEAFARLRERLPQKIRKNGVIAIEYVMTASPEFFQSATEQQKNDFFARSYLWLKEKFNSDNVVVATIHNDEKTPHMSAFVVPIDNKGKLNARSFIGGREKLQADQDSFAALMKDLNLERGQRGSKAKHQSIKQFYATVNKPVDKIKRVSEQEVKAQKIGWFSQETDFAVAERINKRLEEEIAPLRSKAKDRDRLVSDNEKLTAEIAQKSSQMNEQAQVIQKYQNFFKGLSKEQILELAVQARKYKQENEVENSAKIVKERQERQVDINMFKKRGTRSLER